MGKKTKKKGTKNSLRLLEVQIENIKKIRMVRIQPDGSLVIIGGRNGQGKTSLLDSIAWALEGAKNIDEEPVRRGASKGEIVVDLGDLTVTRKFTQKGTSLVVQNAEGEKQKSPQELLNSLYGKLSFDPMKFLHQNPTDQARDVLGMLGLDLSTFDETHQKLYAKRTDENRQLKQYKSHLETIETYPDAPDEEPDYQELIDELEAARKNNQAITDAKSALAFEEEQLELVDGQLKSLNERRAEILKKIDGYEETIEEEEEIDLSDLEQRIENHAEEKRQYTENQRAEKGKEMIKQQEKVVAKINRQMEDNIEERTEAIAETGIGDQVPGLEFDQDGFLTLNGTPLAQCSTSEQLKAAVSIGVLGNPRLRIILIRHLGSLLDDDSMEELHDLAEEHDIQVWIERVGDHDETAVIIEDGEVVEE